MAQSTARPASIAARRDRNLQTFRVVITDFTEIGHAIESEVFADSGLSIELVSAEQTKALGLRQAVVGADALLVQFATIDRPLIQTLTSCKVMARYGVGVDMIDLDAATEMGIMVANVLHYCVDEVSSQAIGFVLDLNRQTFALNAHTHAGLWGSQPPPVSPPSRLRGQVLGIAGLGAIGSEVARKAQALGLEILGYDPYTAPERHPGVSLVSLEEMLRRSDYVSLHCPLVEQTRGLIGAAQFALMKPTAYLLNLARGPVVDQAALVQALRDGQIQGAALDVLVVEPPDPAEPLLHMDNVLVTPHTSSWSVESAIELRREAAQSIVDALQGREPSSVVNRRQLQDAAG